MNEIALSTWFALSSTDTVVTLVSQRYIYHFDVEAYIIMKYFARLINIFDTWLSLDVLIDYRWV